MTASSLIVNLSCFHSKVMRCAASQIHLGDEVFCGRCWKMSSIIYFVGEYRMTCKTCHYGRGFGSAAQACWSAARKHHRKFLEHVVVIYRGERVEHTMLPTRVTQQSLPFCDLPPF